MKASSQARFVRYAPRKVNLILTLVRNKSVVEALKILSFVPKNGAVLIAKTILSAASNAGDAELKNPGLKVTQAWIGQGPTLKRMRPYAMGKGSTYKRKTCHLTVVVADKQGSVN